MLSDVGALPLSIVVIRVNTLKQWRPGPCGNLVKLKHFKNVRVEVPGVCDYKKLNLFVFARFVLTFSMSASLTCVSVYVRMSNQLILGALTIISKYYHSLDYERFFPIYKLKLEYVFQTQIVMITIDENSLENYIHMNIFRNFGTGTIIVNRFNCMNMSGYVCVSIECYVFFSVILGQLDSATVDALQS